MQWNIRNDAPVYAQLIEHITLAIITGEFPPGSRLPSVRELAAEAGVNPNTMQRAFQELERDGLVQTQRTAGRTVTDDAARIERAKEKFAAAAMETYWGAMHRLGYDRTQALALLREDAEMKEGGVEHGDSGM